MNSNAKEEMNPIKEKYKATIIIPAYNAETTIHRAVDGAVNQTTKEPYEILLMDDGSTDSTSHILDDYAKLHKNIRTIHQKNQGITRTRENAAAAALGTYIFWIDADDYADEKGVRIFFWTILVVLTLSLSFLCILLDSCRPR